MDKIYAVVDWEDGFTSIINLKTVEEPRKSLDKYEVNEEIQAPFKGKIYKAVIIATTGEKI